MGRKCLTANCKTEYVSQKDGKKRYVFKFPSDSDKR